MARQQLETKNTCEFLYRQRDRQMQSCAAYVEAGQKAGRDISFVQELVEEPAGDGLAKKENSTESEEKEIGERPCEQQRVAPAGLELRQARPTSGDEEDLEDEDQHE